MIIAGTHDTTLVILSILVAIVASYTALDLAGRVRMTVGAARYGWLVTAAVAMGGGIWSMHFVAMLAFAMPGMEVSYEAGLTVLSLLVAIVATGIGFLIVAQAKGPRLIVLLVSGLVTGLGVAAMHYMGMAAMRMRADLDYDRLWVVVSILIAVGAATAALYLSGRNSRLAERLAAALIMGVAVAGMHYAAMRGSVFRMQPGIDVVHDIASLGQSKLAIGVAGSTFLILFLALIAAMFDRRYTETQSRLQRDLQTAYDRKSLLLRLGDRMRVLDDASAIMAETAETLGRFLRLERTGFYRVGRDGMLDFDHGACWVDGLATLAGRHTAEAFGPSPAETEHPRASVAPSGVPADATAAVATASGIAASIGVPHMERGSWRGGFLRPSDRPAELDERRDQLGGGGGIPDVGCDPARRRPREAAASERAARRASGAADTRHPSDHRCPSCPHRVRRSELHLQVCQSCLRGLVLPQARRGDRSNDDGAHGAAGV